MAPVCLALGIAPAITTLPLHAAAPPSCETPFDSSRLAETNSLTDNTAQLSAGQVHVSADRSRIEQSLSIFEGDVVISQNRRRILGDSARFDRDRGTLQLQGNIELDTGNMQFQADSARLDMRHDRGELLQAHYLIRQRNLRGQAEHIVIGSDDDNPHRLVTLNDSSLSSCPPQQQDWQLSAGRIVLDLDDEYGSANDVVLEFMGIPFFYTPYMEFPIGDKRRSGLLAPQWSDSSSRGFELVVPWYWNIAANQDATLAPHIMRKRGVQLDTRYRFLTRSTRGELRSAWLANDKQTGRARYHTEYLQRSKLSDSLSLNIDIRNVSDINYFTDFSNTLSETSQTHLNRSITLQYRAGDWNSRLRVQTYETVNPAIAPANRPYRRLPQWTLAGSEALTDNGLQLKLRSEWVVFDHKDSSKTTGSRLHLAPTLEWPLQAPAWYLRPALQLNATRYNVEDGSGNALALDDRILPVSSLDSGLLFERKLDNGLLQTLEPRLFYLNAPFREQSALPVFDSSTPTFNFAQLFRNNRFNGIDRIGDANQLTVALSSRLLDPDTGDEYFRASLGQIRYFEDRRVSLGSNIDTSARSALVAELAVNWHRWQSRASVQWNPATDQAERQNFMLHYQSDNRHIFNLAYRQQQSGNTVTDIEQTDVSFVTPLSARTTAFARWKYSLAEQQDIDLILGMGYENCCWSVQVLAQRQRLTGGEYDNTLMLQLVLKGLGSVAGNRLSKTLSSAITGYQAD